MSPTPKFDQVYFQKTNGGNSFILESVTTEIK